MKNIMTKTYTTNTNNETHEIWEDNAGSIYWFVLRDGNAIRCFEDWEYKKEGAIANAIRQIAEDPTAYRNWDGDCVKRIREDSLVDRQDITAQELYDEFAYNDQCTLLYGTIQGYNTFHSVNWKLFADPEAAKLADAIRYAKSWESCKDECIQLCDMAGMADEWDNAEGDTFECVLDRAAEKLHVRIW